jgi:hypothetical protein
MANKMNPGMKAIMAKKMGKPTMKKGMNTAKGAIKKMANGGGQNVKFLLKAKANTP